MLIPFGEILKKYKIEPKGIIHCGAHYAEEHDDYVSYGCNKFIYIEPCRDAFNKMCEKFELKGVKGVNAWNDREFFKCQVEGDNIFLINVACGAESKVGVMYASANNQGQSNSLLEPNLHLEQHPEIVFGDAEAVKVRLLDNVLGDENECNILAMDVQGYEGEVLKGATETLKHIDCIYTEVNRGETYKGNMLIEEMDEYLKDFTRVETYWPSTSWTWGDACYVSRKILSL